MGVFDKKETVSQAYIYLRISFRFSCPFLLFFFVQYASFEDGLKLVKLRGEAMQVKTLSNRPTKFFFLLWLI